MREDNDRRSNTCNVNAVYVESCGVQYRVARLPEFTAFREFALSHDSSWTEVYRKDGVLVESRPPEIKPGEKPEGLKVVRAKVDMPEVDPLLLYDSLHDREYRKSWDHNMVAGYNVCELDERNDIGYYSAKFPPMISNRDFCNLRSWMEFTNGDCLIINHSEPHPECPEKKGFVRGNSICSGYYIRLGENGRGGCQLVTITHSDLRGFLPHWLLNLGLTKVAPSTLKKLETCAINYKQWAIENRGDGFIGKWRTPKVAWDGSVAPPGSLPDTIVTKEVPMCSVIEEEDVEMVELCRSCESTSAEGEVVVVGDKGTVSSLAAPTLEPSSDDDESAAIHQLLLQQQISQLKHHLQRAYHCRSVAGRTAAQCSTGFALAPVASTIPRPDDTIAVQQYRALMSDAISFVDRQYIHEGRAPPLNEYMERLHSALEGMQRTIPAAQ